MPVGFGVNQGDVAPQSHLPAFPVSNRIPGVQPNRLENLDDLLAQAEHYADHSMRNIGRLPPTLFLIGSKGPVDVHARMSPAMRHASGAGHRFMISPPTFTIAGSQESGNGARSCSPKAESWTDPSELYTPRINDPNSAAVVGIVANHNYDGINMEHGATTIPAAIPVDGKA